MTTKEKNVILSAYDRACYDFYFNLYAISLIAEDKEDYDRRVAEDFMCSRISHTVLDLGSLIKQLGLEIDYTTDYQKQSDYYLTSNRYE